jgi:(1->4)-alpha-D-glucan 1-alpha-D-glucosylmutase
LVDPDNRRPVDFNLRQTALAQLEAVASRAPHERSAAVRGLVETGDGSRAKLWVIWQTLGLR